MDNNEAVAILRVFERVISEAPQAYLVPGKTVYQITSDEVIKFADALSTASIADGREGSASALKFAADTIELFDDATMRADYMLDAGECAGIIRALAESPMISDRAATAAKDAAEKPAGEAKMSEQLSQLARSINASGIASRADADLIERASYVILNKALAASISEASAERTGALRDVFAERQRQKDVEGWTPKHDDDHDEGEMARAAACYAYPEITAVVGLCAWPWHESWWKLKDERRNLVKAGALILAEIERLDRASDKASRHAAAEAWLK